MSTATLTHGAPAPTSKYKVTFPRLVSAEFIKLRTVRSTLWSLGVSVLLIVGFAVIMAFAVGSDGDIGLDNVPVGAFAPLIGITAAQLVFVVLGVISIGSEYGTGMIRSTLTAAPTRIPALLSKMVVMAVTSFVVALLSVLVAFFLVQPILDPGMRAALGDDGVLQSLVGLACYAAYMAVFSLAVGAIVRNTAAGISIVMGLLLVLPVVLNFIPWDFVKTINEYLPGNADGLFFPQEAAMHSVGTSWAIALCWTGAATIAALVLLKKRDA